MWNLVTLDGFFEGPKSWELDWHDSVWGDELEKYSIEQSKSTGMLLFGRVTYEGMASYWSSEKGEIADFMNTIPKIVFSKTMKKAEWNNTTLVKGNALEEVAKLKRQPGKNIQMTRGYLQHRRGGRDVPAGERVAHRWPRRVSWRFR